jgi:hypothetical protein
MVMAVASRTLKYFEKEAAAELGRICWDEVYNSPPNKAIIIPTARVNNFNLAVLRGVRKILRNGYDISLGQEGGQQVLRVTPL